jgi:hypothetical protein
VAIFHVNTVGPVADSAAKINSSTSGNSTAVSDGAVALVERYPLLYVAAGMIGFFVLIMNAAT